MMSACETIGHWWDCRIGFFSTDWNSSRLSCSIKMKSLALELIVVENWVKAMATTRTMKLPLNMF